MTQYGNGEENFDRLFKDNKWDEFFDYDWKDVFNIIKHTETTNDYQIVFKEVDDEKVVEILCAQHDFSEDRTRKILETLHTKPKSQKGLRDFF